VPIAPSAPGGSLSKEVRDASQSLPYPGYRLKISRASHLSELVDRVITGLAALGGSAAFLEILRRGLQRRQEKRQEQLQLDVRIMEEGHALRQEAYQREREALKDLAERARAPPQGRASRLGGSDAGEAGGSDAEQWQP